MALVSTLVVVYRSLIIRFVSMQGKKTKGSVNAHATNVSQKRKYRYGHPQHLWYPTTKV